MHAEEHLQIIRQGVDVWNEWREKNPELIPDLHRANLDGANFTGVYVDDANLSEADLSGAISGKRHNHKQSRIKKPPRFLPAFPDSSKAMRLISPMPTGYPKPIN